VVRDKEWPYAFKRCSALRKIANGAVNSTPAELNRSAPLARAFWTRPAFDRQRPSSEISRSEFTLRNAPQKRNSALNARLGAAMLHQSNSTRSSGTHRIEELADFELQPITVVG